jgi:hypothetical protein
MAETSNETLVESSIQEPSERRETDVKTIRVVLDREDRTTNRPEMSGYCDINGRYAEYEIEDGLLRYCYCQNADGEDEDGGDWLEMQIIKSDVVERTREVTETRIELVCDQSADSRVSGPLFDVLGPGKMLLVTVPVADTKTGQPEVSGRCRVDGRDAEYRIDESDKTFAFRYEGNDHWTERRIKEGHAAGNNLVTLICG